MNFQFYSYFELQILQQKNWRILELNFYPIKTKTQKLIISLILDNEEKQTILSKVNTDFKELVEDINKNSNVEIIIKTKSEEDILELLNDLIKELKELDNLKKIESLEKELINNLDESSYSELIKLKNQLNRD